MNPSALYHKSPADSFAKTMPILWACNVSCILSHAIELPSAYRFFSFAFEIYNPYDLENRRKYNRRTEQNRWLKYDDGTELARVTWYKFLEVRLFCTYMLFFNACLEHFQIEGDGHDGKLFSRGPMEDPSLSLTIDGKLNRRGARFIGTGAVADSLPNLSHAEIIMVFNELKHGRDPWKLFSKPKPRRGRSAAAMTSAANSILNYATNQKTNR